jgi:hypothetical protein
MAKILVNVHDRSSCEGHPCCVHNPTESHMYGWPQNFRVDRQFMERVCEHGIGHPDPDHMHYLRRTTAAEDAYAEGIHGCDGCCRPPGASDDRP